MPIVKNGDKPAELRRQATQAVGASRYGAQTLIKMVGKKEVDAQLLPAVAASLHASSIKEIRNEAQKLFPLPPSKDAKPLPPISELIARKGDAAHGKAIFETTGTCAKCHIVNKKGKDVGPDLSEIGSKLSRTAFFESILFPSAGIAHNYEMYSAVLNDGNVVAGLLISKTDKAVTIRNKEGINRTISTGDVDQIVKQKISIMPADLQKLLSEQDLIDVVEYLQTLKKAAAATAVAKPLTAEDRLQTKVNVDFKRTPLQEAVSFVGQACGLKIVLDVDALKRSGYTRNMTVRDVVAENISGKEALRRMISKYPDMVVVLDRKTNGVILRTTPAVAVAGDANQILVPAAGR
jgi:putative heme-binding domain-containing protein